MSRAMQELVHAQVEINRAVFEGNQPKPREEYIQCCIAEAMEDLARATKVLLGIRRLPGTLRPRGAVN